MYAQVLNHAVTEMSPLEMASVSGGKTSTPGERARDFSGSMASFGAGAALLGAEPLAAGFFAAAATSLIVAEFLDL
jgi:hypothetical protein